MTDQPTADNPAAIVIHEEMNVAASDFRPDETTAGHLAKLIAIGRDATIDVRIVNRMLWDEKRDQNRRSWARITRPVEPSQNAADSTDGAVR